jgi:hypothetical protein
MFKFFRMISGTTGSGLCYWRLDFLSGSMLLKTAYVSRHNFDKRANNASLTPQDIFTAAGSEHGE